MSQQGLLHIQSYLYLLASQHNHMTSQGYFCGLLHLLFWFFGIQHAHHSSHLFAFHLSSRPLQSHHIKSTMALMLGRPKSFSKHRFAAAAAMPCFIAPLSSRAVNTSAVIWAVHRGIECRVSNVFNLNVVFWDCRCFFLVHDIVIHFNHWWQTIITLISCLWFAWWSMSQLCQGVTFPYRPLHVLFIMTVNLLS